jgi:Zn-finger nucleic acid-binding protein
MKCPIDDVELVMSERQGIEIDYCPKCRGVWLDRGELDKIIERSAGQEAPRQTAEAPRQNYEAPRQNFDTSRRSEPRYDDQRRPYKKPESFLGELFDFD